MKLESVKKLYIYVRVRQGYYQMADVWKIGQDVKAADVWNNGMLAGEYGAGFIWCGRVQQTDVQKANTLTNMCKAMSETYNQIVDDQNEYLVEVDEEMKEVEALQQELEAKIKAQEAERNKILEAASLLIADGGMEGLSMSKLAKLSAVPQATIYVYFASKEVLLKEYSRRMIQLGRDHRDKILVNEQFLATKKSWKFGKILLSRYGMIGFLT